MAPVRARVPDLTGIDKTVRGKAAPSANEKVEVTKDSPSKVELAELAKTNKPLADTVRRAQAAFGDLTATGGKILVTTSAGNGGKPVLTLVPPGFDPSKPARVQTHYHGDMTSVADKGSYTTQAVKELLANDSQRVIVLPEANGKIGEHGTDWSNVSNQSQTTREALAAAGVQNVTDRTVSAHSAGGRALAKALATPDGVEANRVVLLDCLYEPANTQIKDGLKKNGADVKEIVVLRGTNEMDRADAMVAAFPGRAKKIAIGSIGAENPHTSTARFYLEGKQQPAVPGKDDSFSPR